MSKFNFDQYPSFGLQDLDVIDKTTVFQGFFRLDRYTLRHKLFAGGWSEPMKREVFERGHAVVVLPYNAQTDELVLIEQFRVGAASSSASPWLLEVIAGMIEPGESAEQVAIREAEEEAGLTINELWPMLSYLSSPGGTTERIQLFLGRLTQPVQPGVFGLAEEHEDIKVHVLSRTDAMQLLAEQKIDNAASVIALQWLALNLNQVKQRWGD
ncbi:ADP-ribose diphosphatase [Rheinheimera baltica]|uniref:ADP-ribose diphosphatase n=2 Tax=Rheinheimera baltica TaxID=67576 RepID=UPI00273E3FA3|nr:ADP-ribose diphosphatase [Rheinheimera baltica]MDP5142157.1 ADP-ribose diphosphatase [Rheinheimera baltica]MDP5150477.1 ADP-ribose diphosphatase [Rheinheimera baltica]